MYHLLLTFISLYFNDGINIFSNRLLTKNWEQHSYFYAFLQYST